MYLLNYYNWTGASVTLDNASWFLNTINWEDSSFLLDSDLFFFFNLFEGFIFSNFFSSLMVSYFSFFDFLAVSSLFTDMQSLYNSFFFDFWVYFNVFYDSNVIKFVSNNADFLLVYSFSDYDFFFFFADFNLYYMTNTFYSYVMSVYDVFAMNLGFTYLDYAVYLKWFFLFFFAFLTFFSLVRFKTLANLREFLFSRFYFFFISLGFENRVQLDLVFIFMFFVFFVWVILLMAFDDVNSEVVELFHMFLVVFFLAIIFFLVYKYSVHYFAFLENTISEGYSTSFIARQMVRDVANTFAVLLRFFLLLFRLNIYDGLDDFLDSYYIFFCDFNEDSYFDESVLHTNSFFYFKDNQEDNIFYQPIEQDWFDDLFSRYYIIWGKLFFFWFFILEEIFRVSLALYIFYLIIFEIHSVNVSYVEDNFFSTKRS